MHSVLFRLSKLVRVKPPLSTLDKLTHTITVRGDDSGLNETGQLFQKLAVSFEKAALFR